MANAGGGSWTWVWPAARRRVGVVGLVACLAIGDVGRCCDNPVFRYALENWPSAEYLLVTAGAEAAADAAPRLLAARRLLCDASSARERARCARPLAIFG